MGELGAAVQERLTTLMNEPAPSREMQSRRDAWTIYQRCRTTWIKETLLAWQTALVPPVNAPKKSQEDSFELLGTEVMDNKILASRLVLGLMEKISSEFNDLLLRVKFLEGEQEQQGDDILRPDVLVLLLVEQWAKTDMPAEAWAMINELVLKLLTTKLLQAYTKANEFLINLGVMPTIELADRVKRIPSAAPRSGSVGGPSATKTPPSENQAPQESGQGGFYDNSGSQGAYADGQRGQGPASRNSQFQAAQPSRTAADGAKAGRMGWGDQQNGSAGGSNGNGSNSSNRSSGNGAGGGGYSGHGSSGPHSGSSGRMSSGYSSASDETRMMTSNSPLSRARGRAQGVLGQLKRLLLGSGGPEFEATHFQPPTPALAAAIAVRPNAGGQYGGAGSGGLVMDDYTPAGVARVAGELRQQTTELKNKAETKSEKATIEIVALMFQAILQEDRIPPGIRVWFARLQMPVLRVALAEPDFFGTLNHPARQLIDRMGSCVMGFDASGIQGSALEIEIKRIVQVIEQYPETGKRVYQLVYDEFQKFLATFLTGKASTQKLVSVAQQVEEKETLTIQFTIEMRKMLKDMPVNDAIREFLFKVWAEVLAVAAVRKGPRHLETLRLKKSATDLVWAASAKPNRSDRARVIQDLPQLLQQLRAGMSLLGVAPSEQEAHLKTISDTLAEAFLSKTQAIPNDQIAAMAERLGNLEDFVSDDGVGDLPLDAQSIEMMLGIDASSIDVVANGGSKPTAAMQAWAQELELGAWFTLDHNSRVNQVQFVWRSERKHLNLFASTDGRSYLIQAGRLAAYLQAGLLLPQEEETLTVRATRDALVKLDANPERLLG